MNFRKGVCIVLISALVLNGVMLSACSRKEQFDIKKDTPRSFIHAQGKNLVTDDKTVILKGVNAGGWLLTEDWLTPTSLTDDLSGENGQYEFEKALIKKHGEKKAKQLIDTYRDNWWSEADFKNISELGFNMIRLPFGWEDFTDENGAFKADAFSRADWFVSNCEKYNLLVVLDLHGAYGSQNGRHHSGDTTSGGDLFGNEKNERLTVQLWKAIAGHYKYNKYVAGYDLLNEPEGKPDGHTEKQQWDFYDKLYKAIRSVDKNHLLFLESCWDADNMPDPKDYGWENIAYEYHYYNWENSNDLKSMKSYFGYKSQLEFKLNTLKYRVPVFIGEFTFFDNPDCWRYGLDFFKKHGMSWAMWTYKGNVNSNWVLYSGEERTPDTVVTPETEYNKALAIFKNTGTGNFKQNTELCKIISEYL